MTVWGIDTVILAVDYTTERVEEAKRAAAAAILVEVPEARGITFQDTIKHGRCRSDPGEDSMYRQAHHHLTAHTEEDGKQRFVETDTGRT
jgi:putative NIF3 family GTP cyclohydrolase 1 type 2